MLSNIGLSEPQILCLQVGGNSEWDSQVKKFTVDVHHNYLSNLISTLSVAGLPSLASDIEFLLILGDKKWTWGHTKTDV